MRIIINADDLGISHQVNDATFEAMSLNVISSATLLANGAAVVQAAVKARRFPDRSFGVHLNATEFGPLSRGHDLGPLLAQNGQFVAGKVRELRLGRRLKRALFEEWCAQVDRVRQLGIDVSHIDSHHHVHTIPALFPVLKAVQRRTSIRRVRISANLYSPDQQVSSFLLAKKAIWNMALRRTEYTRTTDAFGSVQSFVNLMQTNRLRTLQSQGLLVELMAHPGHPNLGREVDEIRSLPGWLRALDGRMVTYHDV